MQKIIRRCFGWTVVVGLGLAAPVQAPVQAQAQAQVLLPSERAGAEWSTAVDSGRRTEIQVELAWLSDPLTFACMLQARADGPNLEVRGFVPSQAVREHALKLARLNS